MKRRNSTYSQRCFFSDNLHDLCTRIKIHAHNKLNQIASALNYYSFYVLLTQTAADTIVIIITTRQCSLVALYCVAVVDQFVQITNHFVCGTFNAKHRAVARNGTTTQRKKYTVLMLAQALPLQHRLDSAHRRTQSHLNERVRARRNAVRLTMRCCREQTLVPPQ